MFLRLIMSRWWLQTDEPIIHQWWLRIVTNRFAFQNWLGSSLIASPESSRLIDLTMTTRLCCSQVVNVRAVTILETFSSYLWQVSQLDWHLVHCWKLLLLSSLMVLHDSSRSNWLLPCMLPFLGNRHLAGCLGWMLPWSPARGNRHDVAAYRLGIHFESLLRCDSISHPLRLLLPVEYGVLACYRFQIETLE